MKNNVLISGLLLCMLTGYAGTVLAQSAPSTEGTDFWVTFLRASENDGGPQELKLTVSAREACNIHIENTATGFDYNTQVGDNSSTELIMERNDCYSSTSETPTYTALHVTATKNISLFAGNYRDKSFDAANILPTTALLDDYIIQTYPPSDHDGDTNSQGSHFAIVAVEDNTIVDYVLTAKTSGGKTGAQSTPSLKKGQVYYVWTGKGAGDAADFSGTTVKARNGKKIAVFQGCPHTNLPYMVRDRDHIFSQAMPTAYWGTEFGITASRKHRRDIVAVMALNDGTEVYINAADGSKRLVHTFDFTQDKKHYWTFEIGEELAYCADKDASTYYGQLPEPLIADSSCFLSTSCPAGVHMFMVSNRYDNLVQNVSGDTLVSDPAMLWMSPIEQVIKEINFATYNTAQMQYHYMNILTTTGNVDNMEWNGQSIKQYFHPLMGNEDYSFARIEIPQGNHNLKGKSGFLAHVYGYGQRESYAYSCGSSTVMRSISFNDLPLEIDTISSTTFCVGDLLNMRLNIGNNDYEEVEWDYGDGVTETSPDKVADHVYDSPGWYDLKVKAVYINSCTGQRHTDNMHVSFLINTPDTIRREYTGCVGDVLEIDGKTYTESLAKPDTTWYDCDSVKIFNVIFGEPSTFEFDSIAQDSCFWHNNWYFESGDVEWEGRNRTRCDSTVTMHLTILTCLQMEVENPNEIICADDETFKIPYTIKKGLIGEVTLTTGSRALPLTVQNDCFEVQLQGLLPGEHNAVLTIKDDYCERSLEFPVNFTVLYPTSVFKQKWDNVLAVLKAATEEYNGGVPFSAYQWLKNGEPIEGATGSWYHSEEALESGAEYSVLLTDKNGNQLASCPVKIAEEQAANAPKRLYAQPTVTNSGEIIMLTADGAAEVSVYNTLGQTEQHIRLENDGSMKAPLRTGVYILQARFDDGSRDAVQLIVK